MQNRLFLTERGGLMVPFGAQTTRLFNGGQKRLSLSKNGCSQSRPKNKKTFFFWLYVPPNACCACSAMAGIRRSRFLTQKDVKIMDFLDFNPKTLKNRYVFGI